MIDLDANISTVQDAIQRRLAIKKSQALAPDYEFDSLLADSQAQDAQGESPVGAVTAGRMMPSKSMGPQGHNPSGARYATGIPGGGLTQINSQGQHWTVAKGAASAFQGLLNELAKVGYKTTSSGGFVDRDIRGRPGIKSEHAYGRAIDINAAQNPLGSSRNNLPANISQLASKYGLVWGGNFHGRKDPMHFEYDR